jgi:hypothetical protein
MVEYGVVGRDRNGAASRWRHPGRAHTWSADAAGYVTGTTVSVDGGMTNHADFAHGG